MGSLWDSNNESQFAIVWGNRFRKANVVELERECPKTLSKTHLSWERAMRWERRRAFVSRSFGRNLGKPVVRLVQSGGRWRDSFKDAQSDLPRSVTRVHAVRCVSRNNQMLRCELNVLYSVAAFVPCKSIDRAPCCLETGNNFDSCAVARAQICSLIVGGCACGQ